ncbi:MAG: hypothetical protein IJ859_04770 [Synergistaceae bacterium]|nr:hypothetical protein [Synergistaceae bacterium]
MKVIRKYNASTMLTNMEVDWLRRTAQNKGMTVAEFIRHALDFYKKAMENTTTEAKS